MHYFIICLVAFLTSGLTLFSGFGLGTLLLPVMALFFPIDAAIALTAVVHCLNNLFKFALLGRYPTRALSRASACPLSWRPSSEPDCSCGSRAYSRC